MSCTMPSVNIRISDFFRPKVRDYKADRPQVHKRLCRVRPVEAVGCYSFLIESAGFSVAALRQQSVTTIDDTSTTASSDIANTHQ